MKKKLYFMKFERQGSGNNQYSTFTTLQHLTKDEVLIYVTKQKDINSHVLIKIKKI